MANYTVTYSTWDGNRCVIVDSIIEVEASTRELAVGKFYKSVYERAGKYGQSDREVYAVQSVRKI